MYEMCYIPLLIWSAYVTHFTFPCFFLIVQACKAHAHLYDFALGGESVLKELGVGFCGNAASLYLFSQPQGYCMPKM